MTAAVAGERARDASPSRAKALSGRAAGAMVAQGINAAQSLVFQVLALRLLGTSGFGTYTLISALLLTITSLQTGGVGDGLSVLDRTRREVLGSLLAVHLLFVVVGGAVGAGVAISLDVSASAVAATAALIGVWVTVELGRRMLMARQTFWKLVASDSTSTVAALVFLGVLFGFERHPSLAQLLWALTLGMLTQVVTFPFLIPRSELRPSRPTRAALREVADFGLWRCGQQGLRPFVLFLVRVLIAAATTRAVVGLVEAGRLLLAPSLTFVAGAGSFLLPLFSAERTAEKRSISVRLATLVLVAVTGLSGLIVVLAAGPIGRLLSHDQPPIAAVISWALFAVAFAAGLPAGTALVAARRSRLVFGVRAADSALGLAFAAIAVATDHPNLAPAGVAVGMTLGATWLYVLESRQRGSSTPTRTVPASGLAPA